MSARNYSIPANFPVFFPLGVVAFDDSAYALLRERLTPEVVANYFAYLFDDATPERPPREFVKRFTYLQSQTRAKIKGLSLTRYELPGIRAFNFVLENSLGGGGVASLRPDPQV